MSDSSDNEGKKSKSSQKWTEKLRYISPISKPLAGRKETKHILKLVKKGKYTSNSDYLHYVNMLFWRLERKRKIASISNIMSFFLLNSLILAAAEKAIRRGVKEVVKAVNKETKGYVHEWKRRRESAAT